MSSVTPYVMVASARAFRSFIEAALAARVSNVIPLPTDPGRVLHAEARIGDGTLYFADTGAGGQQCLTTPPEPVHVQLWLTVPDADTVFTRAIAGGATAAVPVTAQEDGSRLGGFVDPFGTLWWVCTTDPASGAAA